MPRQCSQNQPPNAIVIPHNRPNMPPSTRGPKSQPELHCAALTPRLAHPELDQITSQMHANRDLSQMLLHPGLASLDPTRTSPDTAYPSGELDVFLHDGDTLGVDGAEIRVLEKVD